MAAGYRGVAPGKASTRQRLAGHRSLFRRVLEIIEPHTAAASPACTDAYVLLVQGPFAYLPGEGEQYITATRRGGRWRISRTPLCGPRAKPRRASRDCVSGRSGLPGCRYAAGRSVVQQPDRIAGGDHVSGRVKHLRPDE
jgi:hypothetical protein